MASARLLLVVFKLGALSVGGVKRLDARDVVEVWLGDLRFVKVGWGSVSLVCSAVAPVSVGR